jgi:hypothetical protein
MAGPAREDYSWTVISENNLNNQNKIKNMSTNSKLKILLCLALPLAAGAAFCSETNQMSNAAAYTIVPAPTATAVSDIRATDIAINDKIFHMIMMDTRIGDSPSASVNKGVVTLYGTSSDEIEQQKFVNQVWQLAGVEQVSDEAGTDLASTQTGKVIAVR